MYVGYHDANNVSKFGCDPVTQLNFKTFTKIVFFTGTAHHRRGGATGFAAVATSPRAGCNSIEGHTSLNTALVLFPTQYANTIMHRKFTSKEEYDKAVCLYITLSF